MSLREIMIDACMFRQQCAAHAAEEARYCRDHGLLELAVMWQEEAAHGAARAMRALSQLQGIGAIEEHRA